MSYDDFPWFRNAASKEINNLSEIRRGHLYWPDLDVDLTIQAIKRSGRFPLVSRSSRGALAIGENKPEYNVRKRKKKDDKSR